MAVVDFSNAYRAHKKLLATQSKLLVEAANRAAKDVGQHVRKEAGFKHRTGAILRGLTVRIVRSPGGYRLEVGNTAKHAAFLEYGTVPHGIVCRRPAWALRFFWKKVGRTVFFRRVQHPGTPKYEFLKRATTSAFGDMRRFLDSRLTKAAKGF